MTPFVGFIVDVKLVGPEYLIKYSYFGTMHSIVVLSSLVQIIGEAEIYAGDRIDCDGSTCKIYAHHTGANPKPVEIVKETFQTLCEDSENICQTLTQETPLPPENLKSLDCSSNYNQLLLLLAEEDEMTPEIASVFIAQIQACEKYRNGDMTAFSDKVLLDRAKEIKHAIFDSLGVSEQSITPQELTQKYLEPKYVDDFAETDTLRVPETRSLFNEPKAAVDIEETSKLMELVKQAETEKITATPSEASGGSLETYLTTSPTVTPEPVARKRRALAL